MNTPRICATWLIAACTSSAPAERSTPTAEPPAPPVDTTPSSGAAEPAAEPAAENAAAPRAAETSRFHRVAVHSKPDDSESDQAHLRVVKVGERAFAIAGLQVIPLHPQRDVVRDPVWLAGFDATSPSDGMLVDIGAVGVVTLGGRWPDALFAVTTRESGSRGDAQPNDVYRRVNEQWVAVRTRLGRFYSFPAAVAAWQDGAVLGLRRLVPDYEFVYREDEQGPSERQVARAAAQAARTKKLVVLRGRGKAPNLGRNDLRAFDALPSGEIVAVAGSAPAVAIHWDPQTATATTHPLPNARLADPRVTVVAADEAWAWGGQDTDDDTTPYLARWDGQAWSSVPTPACDEGLGSFSTAPGAGLWAVCGYAPPILWAGPDGTLHHRPDDGAWQTVALPDGEAAAEVAALGADDVWVAGESLYHTRARETVLSIPSKLEIGYDLLEQRAPVPLLDCDYPTTLIERDPSGDHKELVDALDKSLRGWKGGGGLDLVEVTFHGEPRLALQAWQSRRNRVLRRAVTAALGDELGKTYCVQRDALREIASWQSD